MNEIAQSTLSPRKLAEKFNAAFPLGTKVRYQNPQGGRAQEATTHTAAVVAAGVPLVWLKQPTGAILCLDLYQIETLPAGRAE